MSATLSSDKEILSLLEPITSDMPIGEALRYTEIYDQIREARREDDDALPQGIWRSEIKKADWEEVARLCVKAIKERSKDLQIAAWLSEAWMHCEGIGGLARGLDLVYGLIHSYWELIYPQIENGSYELRLVPFEWLNSSLSENLHSIQINLPFDRAAPKYTLLDYYEAKRKELKAKQASSDNQAPQSLEETGALLAKIHLSMDQTPTAFYRHLEKSCGTVIQLLSLLEDELRQHLATDAPTFYRLKEKIDDVSRFAKGVLEERGEKADKRVKDTPSSITPMIKESDHLSLESREQAYTILKEIADFLAKAEPHSPAPYLIRRAIHWGNMDLTGVMADIVQHGRDPSVLFDILGIHNPPQQQA